MEKNNLQGFIEVTPKYHDLGDMMMGFESKVTLGKPQMVNVNKIVDFGDGWVNFNPLHDSQTLLVNETYEELIILIMKAR